MQPEKYCLWQSYFFTCIEKSHFFSQSSILSYVSIFHLYTKISFWRAPIKIPSSGWPFWIPILDPVPPVHPRVACQPFVALTEAVPLVEYLWDECGRGSVCLARCWVCCGDPRAQPTSGLRVSTKEIMKCVDKGAVFTCILQFRTVHPAEVLTNPSPSINNKY